MLLLALLALAALDRLGLFGPTGGDYLRYHNRTFPVARVIDGDTLDLAARDGTRPTTRVRLWGVDTPETVDPRRPGPDYFGPEASAFARSLAAGASVRVELVQEQTRDSPKYNRLLAYVYLPDGSMLNKRILETGHGYADLRFEHPRMETFKRLEHKAAREKLGLWKEVRPDQWPEWRQRMIRLATQPDPP